jgi:glycosyltransferase involved in cell wall biosynthesis
MLSVIVPFFNEEKTVREMHARLVSVLSKENIPYEIIFVDDGSQDSTFQNMQKLAPLRVVRLKRNYGQTQALAAGIAHAGGDIIVTLDGDLENDPADIPRLLTKLGEGYDIVSGWREGRWQNQFFTRRLPSGLANKLISYVSGIHLSDHGCTLKAYRRHILHDLRLSGDMHRMIAAYAAREGALITEMPVRFTPRIHGKSKYGLSRIFKVLLDVLAFRFFYKFARRPIHFFGGAGFASFFFGGVIFLVMLYLKFFKNTTFIQTPLPVLVALFIIVGVQFILMGLLAEIFVRSRDNDKNIIRSVVENVRK